MNVYNVKAEGQNDCVRAKDVQIRELISVLVLMKLQSSVIINFGSDRTIIILLLCGFFLS